MRDSETSSLAYPPLPRRVLFLTIYVGGLYVAAAAATHSWRPTGGGEWVWWMSAVALQLFAALSAPFFVKPRDALANSVASAIMLFTVDLRSVALAHSALEVFRWTAFLLAVFVTILATTSIALHGRPHFRGTWRGIVSSLSYSLAVALGSGALMYTPPALVSVVGFYQDSPTTLLWLSALWVFVVTVEPIQLLLRVWDTFVRERHPVQARRLVGHVKRVDDPNIIRVALMSPSSWKTDRLHRARLMGDRYVSVIPLFVQTQDDQLIGTGLCCDATVSMELGLGEVWDSADNESIENTIKILAGVDAPTRLAGFIVESSSIASISFEVAQEDTLVEGTVVFVRDRRQTVYYQILNAETKEEVFAENPRGTHVVVAGQLGTLDTVGRFHKYGWVPTMNAPVFLPTHLEVPGPVSLGHNAFTLGTIAGTHIRATADLSQLADYHAAVLGVTGTGKTELVFEMIRGFVGAGRKVFCVDCTGEYEPRLSDLEPRKLGFSPTALAELDNLVNATEHGAFGATAEKKALHDWVVSNRASVDLAVADFMTAASPAVGIFDLPDIANTRATLRATEMYISAIFSWAKKNRKVRDVVVVLEEAHTVVPETSFYRNDKADTDAVVGRVAQIALQGRKYGVGLLLVSQRTALVSKTLLSQCNTYICFAMYDRTGLDYLASVFPSEYVRAIPHLRFLQGIAFGKAISSERPMLFEIPNDSSKLEASKSLNKKSAPLPTAVPSEDSLPISPESK